MKCVAYIDHQETQYMQECSLTPELLMTQALNDYNTNIISSTWGAPSYKQRQMLALSAEFKTIKENNIELFKTALEKIKNKSRGKKVQDPWKMVRGTGPNGMYKGGKFYHWCTNHKCWNFHKDSEYKGRLKSASTPGAHRTLPSPQAPTPVSYAATFAATMAALQKEDSASAYPSK